MAIDLVTEATALPHPLHVIHGAQDRIVLPDWSREFGRAVAAARVDIIEDAGHYLFYSHWRPVVDALRSLPTETARHLGTTDA